MPFDGLTYRPPDDILDLLRGARARVARPDGWCQHQVNDSLGRVCAEGALLIEAGEPTYKYYSALGYLEKNLVGFWSVAEYNDAHGRTQAEVVALFDRAMALREMELAQTGEIIWATR